MKTEDKIRELLVANKSILGKNAIDPISQYLDNGEHEMAFEGLLIELIKSNKHPEDFTFEEWKLVGEACELDSNGGVFEYEIWTKFLDWGKQLK